MVTIHALIHLIPEVERVREGSRGPGRSGWTSTPRSSTTRPNGSESTRATPSDRSCGIPGRAVANAGRGWNGFFFTPADPTALGLIRVVVGALLFWNLAVSGSTSARFLGTDGWAEPRGRSALPERAGALAWSFWYLVPDGLLRPVWVVCMVVLACYTLGLFSRATAVLAWIIVVSTARRLAGGALRLRPDRHDLALYLAVDGGERAGGLARPVLARYPTARAAVPARRRTAVAGAAGSARADGLGQPGAPADPAPPRA